MSISTTMSATKMPLRPRSPITWLIASLQRRHIAARQPRQPRNFTDGQPLSSPGLFQNVTELVFQRHIKSSLRLQSFSPNLPQTGGGETFSLRACTERRFACVGREQENAPITGHSFLILRDSA